MVHAKTLQLELLQVAKGSAGMFARRLRSRSRDGTVLVAIRSRLYLAGLRIPGRVVLAQRAVPQLTVVRRGGKLLREFGQVEGPALLWDGPTGAASPHPTMRT
jgi:hypothetical protein